jgi:hypothetical protein
MDILERPDPDEKIGVVEKVSYSNTSTDTDRHTSIGWAVLEGLSSSPSIVRYLLSTTGWIELLGVLAGYAKFTKCFSARVRKSLFCSLIYLYTR